MFVMALQLIFLNTCEAVKRLAASQHVEMIIFHLINIFPQLTGA